MSEIDILKETNKGRNTLTLIVVLFSVVFLCGIALSGILIIGKITDCNQKNAAMQSLYSTFLPLIGTWMGAIIAYYFGKENFEAANRSVQSMVQKIITSEDKLKSIKVSDTGVMISIDNITDNKTLRTKTDNAILVEADLLGFYDTNKNIERLPIIDDKYVIQYILHKSLITDFALSFSRKKITNTILSSKTFDTITLDDLINNTDEGYKLCITKSAEYVSKDATLLEAQNKINNSKYCQDVFLTEDGSATKPVIGWITNNKINELGKV